MSDTIYFINKGVGNPIEFKGLQAQYAVYLGIAAVGLLLGFVILYICGLPPLLCVGAVAVTGAIIFRRLYQLSKRYGQFGLMKKRARRKIPGSIESRSRKVFQFKNQ